MMYSESDFRMARFRKTNSSAQSTNRSRKFLMKGFTLIELLVVISIIGILATIVLASVRLARDKAHIARVQVTLNQFLNAIASFESDTGVSPGGIAQTPCLQTFDTPLDTCEAGVVCNSGYANWSGPYMSAAQSDPWGNMYRFNARYTCEPAVSGCENLGASAEVRAVLSIGPDDTAGTNDDIVFAICR